MTQRVRPRHLSRLWADLPLWAKGLAVLALPVSMLLLSITVMFWAQRVEQTAADWVEHTVRVKYTLTSLQAALSESISLVRGYALVRDETRLGLYQAEWIKARQAKAELGELIRDNPEQLERLGQIETRMAELRENLEATLSQAGQDTANPAFTELIDHQRKVRDELHRLMLVVGQGEDRLLTTREATHTRTQTAVVLVLGLSLGLGALSGILASVLLSRGIVSRVGSLTTNATRLVRGETLLPLPPADDELGRLDQAQQEAYQLLQAERERLQMAMAASELGFFELNLDTQRVQIQTALRTPEGGVPVLPQTFEGLLALVFPEDRPGFKAAVEHTWARRSPLNLEYRVSRATGQVEWWVIRGQRYPDRIAGMMFSVNQRKMAEQERERLYALLQATVASVDEGLLAIDNQGSVQFYNPQLLDLWQIPAEVLQVQDFDQRLQHFAERVEDPQTYLEATHKRFASPEAEGTDLVYLRGGRVLERIARVQRLGGESLGRLWVFRDITQRVLAENTLRSARMEAERARQSAEAANRAKSEFLSRMSHELRTPMNAILGFGQLLQMENPTPAQRESIEQILKAGRHLLQLINEVLDISRIEAGRMTLSLEPLHLDEVVQECLNLVRLVAGSRNIQLNFPAPESCHPIIQADRQRLKQVLLNLLSNAIKYNHDGGMVSLFCRETAEGTLMVGVQDTGPGIAPELLERLFTPFDRLGAEQGREEGTGLGLALSKALIEAMQGRLWAESTLGQGSTFWVELPLASPMPTLEPARPAIEPPQGVPDGARNLLYIEDNLANLRLVERVLARWPNVQLLSAMQGRLGLELALSQPPDLILLDLHLPDLPGQEVLARLKAHPQTRAIPVIVLSADASDHQIERLLTQGATAYLTKPLDLEAFYRVLRKALGGSSEQTLNPPA